MDDELRKAAQGALDWFENKYPEHMTTTRLNNVMRDLRAALAKNASAAPQDQDAKDAALRSIPDLAWEIYDHWDNDREMKVGKCLMALAGRLKNYDPRFTAIHEALRAKNERKSHD